MTVLTQASNQWFKRPDDQRFTSLDNMQEFLNSQRLNSRETVVGSRKIEAQPTADDAGKLTGMVVVGPDGTPTIPTNWAFNQLCQRADAPSSYLRKLPADLAADCINDGLLRRPVEDVGALMRRGDGAIVPDLAALTGPRYGRVWNADIVAALRNRFGDGITGDFTVPGEFGKHVDVTKANTTLFASDRDMFVFLADETNRIEVPNRRNGQPGSLARGFFVWNSEVGSTTLGISTFLFDYVCSNRMVWGVQGQQEIKIRHSSGAPDRFVDEVTPALLTYAKSSAQGINDAISAAQSAKIGGEEEVREFLVKRRRFSDTQAKAINLAHLAEEGRPVETLWDATVAITAYAKGVNHQDDRVDLERRGGDILNLAE